MDWDLEKYRNSSEPEAHWELKRDFMKSIKHMFPEERVVCLAQVLGNIQFMGCRYPHDTMVQVQELARDVIKEYNDKMGDDRITRTLVSVSSAAKDKVNKTNASVKRSATDITDSSSGSLGKKPKFMNFVASTSNDEEPKKNTNGFILPPIKPKSSGKEETPSLPLSLQRIVDISKNNTYPQERKLLPLNFQFPACYFILVTYEDRIHDVSLSILQRSSAFCKIPLKLKYNKSTKNYQVSIANHLICEETGKDASEAKLRACDMALDILSEYCYKISLKNSKYSSDGAHVDIIDVQDNTKVGKNQEKLGDSNIGHKLLSMMGWSGGGLGKEGAGITEPITAESMFGKQGLGFKDNRLRAGKVLRVFKQKIEKIIKEYMGTSGSHDLVFTTGFDNEQRAEMHALAKRYGLKSKSFGIGDTRHLTISKMFDPKTLLEELLYDGGETGKYILKPPDNLREEFYRMIE